MDRSGERGDERTSLRGRWVESRRLLRLLCLACAAPCFLTSAAAMGADSDSAQSKGKALYQKNCASCHGATGRGDGKAAQSLNPPPRSFEKTLPTLKRRDAMEIIVEGKGQMPAWGDVLSSKDVKAILDYLDKLYPKKHRGR